MTTETDFNPVVQAWEDSGRPHPFATFRDGYEAGVRSVYERAEASVRTVDAGLIRNAGEQKS